MRLNFLSKTNACERYCISQRLESFLFIHKVVATQIALQNSPWAHLYKTLYCALD